MILEDTKRRAALQDRDTSRQGGRGSAYTDFKVTKLSNTHLCVLGEGEIIWIWTLLLMIRSRFEVFLKVFLNICT